MIEWAIEEFKIELATITDGYTRNSYCKFRYINNIFIKKYNLLQK